ncbi:MAG: glycosyltransferase family 2 protein [Bacillota bacterium]|nr:glycosyltransferase family 2 protein [Bacillota bacterium]
MINVSVVIPAYNEGKSIKALLSSLINGSRVPDEIIVVDAASQDGTSEAVNKFIMKNREYNIKLIRLKDTAFPGRARNIGAKASDNDYIAFIDCGIIPDKFWLERLSLPFEIDNKTDVVWGKCMPSHKNSWEKSLISVTKKKIRDQRCVPSSCIKKNKFYQLNMFREDLRACEDILYVNQIKKLGLNEAFTEANSYYSGYPGTASESYKKWLLYAKYNVLAGVYKKKLILILIQVSLLIFLLLYKFPCYLMLILLFQIIRTLITVKLSPVKLSNFKEYINAFIIINVSDFGRAAGIFLGLKKRLFSK